MAEPCVYLAGSRKKERGAALARMACLLQYHLIMIAITTWNGAVSPLFDAAGTLELFTESGVSKVVSILNLPIGEKIRLLKENGVDRLICGAISSPILASLHENGITVTPWIRGQTEEVYSACLKNRLMAVEFRMPGCGFGRHCKKDGRRRGRPA